MNLDRKQEQLLREMIREELNEISISGAADWLKGRLGVGKKKDSDDRPKAVNQLIKEFREEIVKDVESIELAYKEVSNSTKLPGSEVIYALNSFTHGLNNLGKKLMQVLSSSTEQTSDKPVVKSRLKMLRLGRQDGETIVNDAVKAINEIKRKIKAWKNVNMAKEKSVFKKGGENEIVSDMGKLSTLKRLAQEGQMGVIKYSDV